MASRRRGQGEGSIGFYGGRWVAQATVSFGVRKRFYGKTRAEAAAKLQEALASARSGLVVPSGRQTVAGYLEDWLAGASHALRPSTASTYERHTRLHVLPAIGQVPVTRLQASQLDRLYAELLSKGLSRTTVQHVHSILRRALKQAVRRGIIARNPIDLIDPPGRDHPEMRVLTAAQARALLVAARQPKHDRFEAMYVLALTTGMRRGELFALRWKDVDLPGYVLLVTGTLDRVKRPGARSSLVRAQPKTKTSMRRIPLTTTAVEALSRHHKRQETEKAFFGEDRFDSGLVFTNERGRPLEPSNFLRRSFKPLLVDAGLPQIRFHDLRHTAATLMAAEGVHTKVISEMLGHASIGITLDLYAHVTQSMGQQAVAAMEDLFASSRSSG